MIGVWYIYYHWLMVILKEINKALVIGPDKYFLSVKLLVGEPEIQNWKKVAGK